MAHYAKEGHISKERIFSYSFSISMSIEITSPPLFTLPMSRLYHITILLSVRAVCTRINAIADSHLQDKVNYRLTKIVFFLLVIKCYLEGDEHFFFI